MVKRTALCLGLLLLCSWGVSFAAEPAASGAPQVAEWVFQTDVQGRIHLVQVKAADAEPIDAEDFIPGTACFGGSCVPAGGGSVSCPSTGTLRCKVGQDCLCKCHKDANGSWYGKNECV